MDANPCVFVSACDTMCSGEYTEHSFHIDDKQFGHISYIYMISYDFAYIMTKQNIDMQIQQLHVMFQGIIKTCSVNMENSRSSGPFAQHCKVGIPWSAYNVWTVSSDLFA